MKYIIMALTALLPLCVTANEDDETLSPLLAKSDLVVLGIFVSEPAGFATDIGVEHYSGDFLIEDVLKGDASLSNTTILVGMSRFVITMEDRLPLIKKDSRCILFLKQASDMSIPAWVTTDFWFGVQHPLPVLARTLIRLANENKVEQSGPAYPPQGVGSADP
mgnify:CR=1 FL=1